MQGTLQSVLPSVQGMDAVECQKFLSGYRASLVALVEQRNARDVLRAKQDAVLAEALGKDGHHRTLLPSVPSFLPRQQPTAAKTSPALPS